MSGVHKSEHSHRLKRPKFVGLDVAKRCAEADRKFYDAIRHALWVRIEEFETLMECAESPTEVLACMESLHSVLEWSKNCNESYSDDGDWDTSFDGVGIDTRLIDAEIESHVLPALECFFVWFAEKHSIEIQSGDDYRDLWGGNDSGKKGLDMFYTPEGQQTFRWKRLFNSIFEEVRVPVDIDGGVLVHETECRKRKARED